MEYIHLSIKVLLHRLQLQDNASGFMGLSVGGPRRDCAGSSAAQADPLARGGQLAEGSGSSGRGSSGARQDGGILSRRDAEGAII